MSEDLVVAQNGMEQMVISEEKTAFIFTSESVLARHQTELDMKLIYYCLGSVCEGGDTECNSKNMNKNGWILKYSELIEMEAQVK